MNPKSLRVLEYEKIKEMLRKEVGSQLGKELIDALEPSSELAEIKYILGQTSEATTLLMKHTQFPMGRVHDLSTHIRVAEIGSFLYPGQLLEVCDSLRSARRMKNFITKQRDEVEGGLPILGEYADFLTNLKPIEEDIDNAIAGENEVSDSASPDLRKIRRSIDNKNASIRKKLDSVIHASQNQKYLQDAIVTIRQDRFVVPVKSEYKNMIKGLVHDQSSSGATLYIEPMAVVELNNQLKELKLDEKKEIERILRELTASVGGFSEEVRTNQKYLAILDFIVAKAKLSLKMKAIEPKLNDKGALHIKNGRHPLLEAKTVVPSNVWIGKEFTSLLITGPNTGGKTVTLKTVGLLALMTQSGLHIPADYGTEMAVFDSVYADIGDEQSIEQSLSTFSSHMTNIVNIIENVTEKSLVLFDELGAGTDPAEGAALAMAILTRLYDRKIRTIATTHYSELKQFALVHEGMENASVEFDVESLSPTYRLLIGVPGKSNAFEISLKLGLRADVIDAARALVKQDDIEFEEVLNSIEENRKTAESERDEAIRLRFEMEKLKKKLEEKEARIANQRDKHVAEAKKEARAILKKAKEESEEIIKDLRGLKKNDKDKNKEIEKMRRKLRDNMNDVAADAIIEPDVVYRKIPKDLKLGQSVKVVSLGQKGNVLSLPDKDGDLQVQIGIMKMKVNVKNLMLMDDSASKDAPLAHKRARGSDRKYASVAKHMSTEIDLRGKTLEEAEYELDKYLDDACLASLESVRVIHGKGTGALRAGLKDFFKYHHHVRSFAEAPLNQGGSGVTIVELK